MEREAELQKDHIKKIEAANMKARELEAIRNVDSTIVVSSTELELLKPQLPEVSLEILPLLLNIPGTNVGFLDRKDFCFVGGFQHTPNIDAVLYFTSEIMPIIRKKLPGVKFHIIGSKPTPEILALNSEDIVVHGFIDDLNAVLGQMRLSVAPLRYGAGVKGKVGTSMAAGLPSVISPIAAEGMSLTDGQHAIIASNPHNFANSVIELYTDNILWEKISLQGLNYSKEAWGPNASFLALHSILYKLLPNLKNDKKYELALYSERFK